MNPFLGYIDPGLGSLLIQLLIAGIVGTGFYFRKAISHLFHIFKPTRRDPKEE